MTIICKTGIALALIASWTSANTELEPGALESLLGEATAAIDWGYHENWAYTVTAVRNDTVWIARYDPGAEGSARWTLLSVDGRIPDAGEIDDFFDEKDAGDGFAHDARDVFDLVEPGSLAIIEETDDQWLLGFTPDDEDLAGHADGRIRIVKDGPRLQSIELRNHSLVKEDMGTRIENFLTRFTYAPGDNHESILPRSIEVRIRGRALFFIGFDETEVVRFSDYEYKAD